MADAILVDGEWRDTLPADDRGLSYGDGVFRTLRVAAGRPLDWSVHLERLAHDCARLGLTAPTSAELAADAGRLFSRPRDAVLKIIVTRGSGGRGYAPPRAGNRRIVSVHGLPIHAQNPPGALSLERSPIQLAQQPLLAGIKHLNRLEQVLARAECERLGQADAIMCTDDDRVIGTTMRNLFFRDANGRWYTPSLEHAGIAGATRQRLMAALANAGNPVALTHIAYDALDHMSAALACNSVGGVAAVSRIGHHAPAQSGPAAAYCRKLLEARD